ncbi:hypothetical protein K501DRAFT_266051 [Backusella circina FSU 941]|nr:hypothetical protein K501DRAFT_266051 [Backusella circina FSU 941]
MLCLNKVILRSTFRPQYFPVYLDFTATGSTLSLLVSLRFWSYHAKKYFWPFTDDVPEPSTINSKHRSKMNEWSNSIKSFILVILIKRTTTFQICLKYVAFLGKDALSSVTPMYKTLAIKRRDTNSISNPENWRVEITI